MHNKTYNKSCVTSKDSDQSVQPPNMARVLLYPSLGSLEATEDTCDQRRLWLDWANAQADLSLHWSQKSYCRFCHALAHIMFSGLGGSVGCAVWLETRRSRVQPPPRSATFFRGDWSWNIFYGHSLPSAGSRRAVVSSWRKNVHSTG